MRHHTITTLFAIILVIYFESTVHVSATEKTMITYNVGLYEAVGLGIVPNPPSREARRDAIINELKASANDADVACLQEVYIADDMDEIIDEVAAIYPHSFSALHDANGNLPLNGRDRQPACGDGLLQGLWFYFFMNCAESNCNNPASIDEGLACIISNCLAWYAALSQECTTCILITAPDIVEIKQKCSRPLSIFPWRYRQMNIGGLLLLSKTSLSSTSYVDFHPESKEYLGHYSYLEAQVAGIGQVVCTHVKPLLAGTYSEYQILLNEGITSYESQNAAELNKLVTAFGGTSPVFLLGDFNVGDVEAPENYLIMTAAFQTHKHDECTFCNVTENAYNAGYPSDVIDHIFFNGATYNSESSLRIFYDTTVGGNPLSDHYGVKQTFTLP